MRFTESRLWVFLVAALLPLALFSVVMLAVFNAQQRDALETIMREAAGSASNAIDSQVNATVAVLSALAASSEFRSEDWPAFAEHVRPVVEGAGWLTLAVTDDDGQIFNLRGLSGVADRIGMEEALRTGRPAVSNLVPSGPNNDEPAVVIRVPILRAGQPPRTLAAFVPARAFTKLLHDHVPENWLTALADRDGTILARSHLADRFVGTPLAPTVYDAWRDGRSRVFDAVTKEGTPSYGRVTRAGTAGWALAMGAPKSLVDGRYRLARNALWLGGGLAGVLTLVLAAGLMHMVRRSREAAGLRAADEVERRLNYALECANAGMWDWDIRSGRILWSKEYYRLYGLPPDLPPSYEAWLDSIHPDDRRRAQDHVASVLAEGVEDFRIEFRILHPQHGVRWLLGIGRLVAGSDGRPSRMSGVNVDITDRKRMEAAVRDALAEAERANLAKSRFLAAASHDIRQPIQSLMLFAHALSAGLQGHAAAPIVEKMSAALGALKLLLDSILDISKLDAGLVTPEVTAFPLAAFLDRLAAEYQPRMAAKGLSFRVVPASGWVESDPTLLGRIVGNLLENALKYTNQGGVVLGCRRHGGKVAITVADTGVGIAAEHQQEVFQEFVQIGTHGRDRAQGMGLGLATVQRMGALLGHPVGVRSQPGRGSAFWVEVPRAEACGFAASDADAAAGAAARVLVVDDEVGILDGMRAILEQRGHDVAVAGSADEALRQVTRGFTPDVVVTDYRLPQGHNGFEVIDRVRHACHRTIPCVVLTGDTEIVAARLPATTLMHKPVDPRDLERAIGQLCRAA